MNYLLHFHAYYYKLVYRFVDDFEIVKITLPRFKISLKVKQVF